MSAKQLEQLHNIPAKDFPDKRADSAVGRIKKWAFKLDHNENKMHGIWRSWVRIVFIMSHEFSQTAIPLRASALTYSIVLSMVPFLAMSTAVLKGLGSDNQLKVVAYRLIDQLEPEKQQPQTTGDPSASAGEEIKGVQGNNSSLPKPVEKETRHQATEAETASPTGENSMTAHLRNAVDTIFDYVDRTNFAAIGAFGIVGLLFAVILVLSTIEGAMNEIWHAKKGRSIGRKVMDYLALLILLPISINVALASDTILESPRIMSYIQTVIPSAWAVATLLKLLPFLVVILSLMVMYQFFPNVRVKAHAALTGAIFAGFFWFVVQRLYIVLQVGVARYNAIYGSFATVPLFLIWIQLGWTFILLGATLAYAVQNRHQYHMPGAASSPQKELQLAFDILNTIYTRFANKQPSSIDDLAAQNMADLPGDIQKVVNRLVEGGLLHKTESNGNNYVPVTSQENVEARDVVKLFFGHETIPTPGGEFSNQVLKAAEEAIPRDAFPVITQSETSEQIPPQETRDEETV